SGAAILLAKLCGGEIISADSMQIYRHMDIGTAKITMKERQGVAHHMLDVIEPYEEYSVSEYQKAALEIMADIESRGKTVIVAGGTGLYINSLIYPLRFCEAAKDETLRNELVAQAEKAGADSLYDRLSELDPAAAAKIHRNNVKRVIRALEIKILSGKSIAECTDKGEKSYYRMYAFDFGRMELYKKIEERVDNMMEDGLAEEVQRLMLEYGLTFEHQSMQAIGYKEFKDFFEGKITRSALMDLIKRNTRKYAKRQFTWFKAYDDCKWLNKPLERSQAEEILEDYYRNKPILE
ncbi:MAG: tRNA (adenosine(37)-N6)-dimethylallyltransferase MiaA, partial [Clostridia bacterium]|nr:tRNA (adenosine(37)-N6)-dimethylallyltransferase MiaA [Clostridia bacterium]